MVMGEKGRGLAAIGDMAELAEFVILRKVHLTGNLAGATGEGRLLVAEATVGGGGG